MAPYILQKLDPLEKKWVKVRGIWDPAMVWNKSTAGETEGYRIINAITGKIVFMHCDVEKSTILIDSDSIQVINSDGEVVLDIDGGAEVITVGALTITHEEASTW